MVFPATDTDAMELERNVKNFDFSSIKKNSTSKLGKEQWIKTRDNKEIFSRVYESENKDIFILIHGSGSESRYLSNFAIRFNVLYIVE